VLVCPLVRVGDLFSDTALEACPKHLQARMMASVVVDGGAMPILAGPFCFGA